MGRRRIGWRKGGMATPPTPLVVTSGPGADGPPCSSGPPDRAAVAAPISHGRPRHLGPARGGLTTRFQFLGRSRLASLVRWPAAQSLRRGHAVRSPAGRLYAHPLAAAGSAGARGQGLCTAWPRPAAIASHRRPRALRGVGGGHCWPGLHPPPSGKPRRPPFAGRSGAAAHPLASWPPAHAWPPTARGIAGPRSRARPRRSSRDLARRDRPRSPRGRSSAPSPPCSPHQAGPTPSGPPGSSPRRGRAPGALAPRPPAGSRRAILRASRSGPAAWRLRRLRPWPWARGRRRRGWQHRPRGPRLSAGVTHVIRSGPAGLYAQRPARRQSGGIPPSRPPGRWPGRAPGHARRPPRPLDTPLAAPVRRAARPGPPGNVSARLRPLGAVPGAR